jgi:Mn-dependent DtxR family transcriptional regulator
VFPTEKELITFIKRKGLVNFSMIARHFEIQNTTVSDLIASLEKKKILSVKKLGGSKIVLLKK